MAYCVTADVQRVAGGADRLRELSDLESSGVIDAAAVTQAIEDADGWIDSYLTKRYTTPVATVPKALRRCSAQEAVYRLKQAKYAVEDQDKEQHEERRIWLEAISRGHATLGVDPESPKSAADVPELLERDVEEDDSRDAFKGFV